MVGTKALITLLLYCSKGKWRILLCKQIAKHNLRFKLVFTSLRCNSFCTNFVINWFGRVVLFMEKKEGKKLPWSAGGPLECGPRVVCASAPAPNSTTASILTSAPGPLELKQLTHHHISPWVWGTSPCMHLCSYAKHADAVPDKNFQFWSYLIRAPCSSHNVNDVWKIPCVFFCVLWSEKAYYWQPFQWGCGYGATKACNSFTVIPGDLVAFLTILLSILGGKMQLKTST